MGKNFRKDRYGYTLFPHKPLKILSILLLFIFSVALFIIFYLQKFDHGIIFTILFVLLFIISAILFLQGTNKIIVDFNTKKIIQKNIYKKEVSITGFSEVADIICTKKYYYEGSFSASVTYFLELKNGNKIKLNYSHMEDSLSFQELKEIMNELKLKILSNT